MAAKSLPRWRLVGARRRHRRAVRQALGRGSGSGWLVLLAAAFGQGAAAGLARSGRRRSVPRARRDLHQGRPDHEHAARPHPRVHLDRARRAAGRRRPVPVRGRRAHRRGRPGPPAERRIFAEFAPVPLASASVSQVHKARLPDGRIVAVKVRRPDVVELCTFDLVVMRMRRARARRASRRSRRCRRSRPSRSSGAPSSRSSTSASRRATTAASATTSAATPTSSSPRSSRRCRASAS